MGRSPAHKVSWGSAWRSDWLKVTVTTKVEALSSRAEGRRNQRGKGARGISLFHLLFSYSDIKTWFLFFAFLT